MKIQPKHAQRMSRDKTLTPVWDLMPQVEKDFAGVRGRVQRAVEASPRSVTFTAAVKQIQLFSKAASKTSSESR